MGGDRSIAQWRLRGLEAQCFQTTIEDGIYPSNGRTQCPGNLVARNFCSGQSWQAYLNRPAEYDAVSREKVIEVAKKYYGDNYLLISSNTGTPKKDKLEKPGYKPPIPKADTESEYGAYFRGLPEGKPKAPICRLEKDFTSLQVADKVMLHHASNPLNSIFELEIRFGMGTRSKPILDQATQYMNLVGSKKQSSEEIRQQLNRKWTGLQHRVIR